MTDVPSGPLDAHRAATLLYPVVDGEVLLVRKKRGIGAGNLVGPGGKVEPGETAREAAVRETREEVAATPADVRKVGEVDFRMGGEPVHYIHVFRAGALRGTPGETDEARPVWVALGEVPYQEMWESDRHWVPHVFEGTSFRASVRYDDDEHLLDHAVETGVDL